MRMSSATSPLRILLVEDLKGDALIIEKVLQQAMPAAHVLQKTETLAEALTILAVSEFDIVLLDRSLPDVVGYSGLQSIQNLAPKLPVVFLTAYKDESTAFEAIEQGAQDYLFKDKLDAHTISRAIQFAIIRKQFESVLVVQANFDNLTGLANRMLFENRLDMAIARMQRQGGSIGVLFLDLDRFKQVNDTYGHAIGDRLLAEIGKRLKMCLRPYDTAARFGGDEFAMLIEGIADKDHCAVVAQKIIKSCEQPFMTSGLTLQVGASIGVTTCVAKQKRTRSELMRQADTAMYEAKKSPESAYRMFANSEIDEDFFASKMFA
jgi:diguanylate cyclase (GGDEF)-like protein